jgi:hypothetical protein
MASCKSVLMVSERGRYCNSDVLSFRRMRVNLPVLGSLDSSQMPAQLVNCQQECVTAHVTAGQARLWMCLQSQSWRPQHLNTGQEKLPEVQDVVANSS